MQDDQTGWKCKVFVWVGKCMCPLCLPKIDWLWCILPDTFTCSVGSDLSLRMPIITSTRFIWLFSLIAVPCTLTRICITRVCSLNWDCKVCSSALLSFRRCSWWSLHFQRLTLRTRVSWVWQWSEAQDKLERLDVFIWHSTATEACLVSLLPTLVHTCLYCAQCHRLKSPLSFFASQCQWKLLFHNEHLILPSTSFNYISLMSSLLSCMSFQFDYPIVRWQLLVV